MRDPFHKGNPVLWTMAVLFTAVLAVSSTNAAGDDPEDNVDTQRENLQGDMDMDSILRDVNRDSIQGDLDRDSIHFDGARHEEIDGDYDEGVHEMGDDREDLRNDREEREQIENPIPSNDNMLHESLHELENEIKEEKH